MTYRRVVCFAMGLGIALAASPCIMAQGGTYKLSLDECLRTALENNLDLVSAMKDPEIAEQQIQVQKAPFDGVINAGANLNHVEGDEFVVLDEDTTDPNNAIQTFDNANEQDVLNADVSFSQRLRFGANYTAEYNFTDFDDLRTEIQPATGGLTTNDTTGTSQGLTLTYTMPFLDGFGKEVNTVDLLLARNSVTSSKERLRLDAILTAQRVEDAYWDLLASREGLRISRLALERANDLLQLNRKKVEVGTLAPIEITEAEAGVASQVEAVIVAETALENAEDVLLQLLAIPEEDPVWERSVEPTDSPSFVPVDVDVADALATALEQRPEMATARQDLRDRELSERVAKRRIRHGLDMTATLTPDKQDDTDRLTAFPLGPGRSSVTESSDSDWSIRLDYTYALGQRSQKANYTIARLNTEKTTLALQNAEQDIRIDVRRAVRNLQSGMKRVEAARKNVELQEKKLEAEKKKFDNGMSTSFEVLTFQKDLADAELGEINARLEYLKSVTDLERAKGTLLEARGLSLGK